MRKRSDAVVSKEDFAFLEITGVDVENSKVKTFHFEASLNAEPGQFVMLWLPGVDAKPFGVMSQDKTEFAVTVANVGVFTEKLFRLKKGDCVGIQGPFGKSFVIRPETKSVALIAGGFGAAPLAFLAQRLRTKKIGVVFIEGAKTKSGVILEKRLRALGCDFRVATDDGSCGFKGYCTALLEKTLSEEKQKIDCVFACGPERMMQASVKICGERGVPIQFSLERFMKCGYGVCGQCACGSKLVCKDGPVFTPKDLPQLSDFGVARRDASGTRVPL